MAAVILSRLLAKGGKIKIFTRHLLHRAHTVDVFRQRTVDDGGSLARTHKSAPRGRQPDRAYQNQHRHHRQREQRKFQIEDQQHNNDAYQQRKVADGEDR